MSDQPDHVEQLQRLLSGLTTDAATYFDKAKTELGDTDSAAWFARHYRDSDGNEYWSELPDGLKEEAIRLEQRLVSLMGQIVRSVRNAPLVSEADQRDVMTGTKAMRAALHLRLFRSWDAEVLNNEDIILGVMPPG